MNYTSMPYQLFAYNIIIIIIFIFLMRMQYTLVPYWIWADIIIIINIIIILNLIIIKMHCISILLFKLLSEKNIIYQGHISY